jgi:putative protein-disulfide isomerase
MDKTLYYLFDPLCGWCYGASPALAALLDAGSATVRLLPTGLFADEGARPMDDSFAAYAWSNDQRIERLTGQRFTEQYRSQVLANRRQPFDSAPATMALTAVALTEPAREFSALKAIQQARYVAGLDVTSLQTLAEVLAADGLAAAAGRIAHPDAALVEATGARVEQARKLMQDAGAQGVPTFIVEAGGRRRMLHSSAIYTHPHALIDQVAQA